MLISKFDLYKTEWLELVFDDRNKAYGAYELRQHNGRTMMTAMAIAFTVIAIPFIIMAALFKPIVVPVTQVIHEVHTHDFVIEHPKVIQPPKSVSHEKHVISPPAITTPPKVFIPLVVSATPAAIEPPKVSQLTGPISSTVTPTAISGHGINDGPGGTTSVPGNGTGDVPVPFSSLERMPEPYGGASAWAKFLQKHLKYPDMAVDARMQGKVFVSFIVEKDGHLSNITIDRGIGYGLDEEALRVLKLAPAWMPGIQNGQPVRVKYNIPINFKLGDDND